jgi:tetratricopeptide (TPR) repeat protein/predicted Ser/Thr protein kinase
VAELDEVGVLREAQDRLDALEREGVWGRLQEGLFGSRPAQSQLDRFVILERLGSGGQGRVYLAYDPKLARRVAIKLVRPDVDADAQEQLLREAQALAQLAHPNIVAVHDVGTFASEGEDVVFIVMEYVEGPTLGQWLAESTRTPDEVLARFEECGRGLAHAHAHGIVHRDFKPSNAIVAVDGRCRILDFGLARAPASAPNRSAAGSSSTAGTPAYMAPEQHEGGELDARTDQYAFCVALWAALTGERPFVASATRALVEAKRAGPPPARDRLLEVCRRGLAWDPAQRFASMDALLHALTRARGARRRRVTALAIGAAAIAIIGGSQAYAAHRSRVCAATATPASAMWIDARPRVEQALLDTNTVFAADTARWVDARIDAFVAEWSAEREATCVAERIDATLDEVTASRHIACLDTQLRAAEALVGVLADADLRVVTVAIAMAGSLPSPASCRDARATAVFAAVDAPAVLDPLDRARWLRRSGRLEASRALVDRAAANAIDEPALQSRVALERALASLAEGDPQTAESAAREAWIAAEHARADDLAVRAIAVLADAIARGRGDLRESLDLGEVALARVESAELAPHDVFAVERTHAHVANLAGLYDVATTHAEAAIEAARAMAPDHPDVAAALVDLGNVQLRAGRYDAGLVTFTEAETITASAFSSRHPDLLAILNGKAGCLRGLGRLKEALAVTDEALALAEATQGRADPLTDMLVGNRGMLLAKLGDPDGAVRDLGDALARKESRLGPDNRDLLGPLIELAQVHADRRDFAEALALLDRAARIVETHHKVPDPLSAKALVLRGEVASALEHRELACASFAAALAAAARLPDIASASTLSRAGTGIATCGMP